MEANEGNKDVWGETSRVLGLWRNEVVRLFASLRGPGRGDGADTPEYAENGVPRQGRRLYRSRRDRKIAGVCAGLADYFGVSPTLVRLVAVALLFTGVIHVVILYLALVVLVPEAPWEEARR